MTTDTDLRALWRELGQRLDDARIAVAAPWPAMGYLLEAMRARGWYYRLAGDDLGVVAQFWQVDASGWMQNLRHGAGKTLPEAVAHAARAALEVEA